MTSSATLIERLRRAAMTAEPERDVAVVLSEFVDDGGLEPVDNPFHAAQREPNTGLVATIASNKYITVTLIRSADGVFGPPQRHGLPIAVAVLAGRVVLDIFTEIEPESTDSVDRPTLNPQHDVEGEKASPQGGIEALPGPNDTTQSEGVHDPVVLSPSPPPPHKSELLSAGSSEVLPDEVTVVQGDVVHRTTFAAGIDGLALHVAIGDLRSAMRERWIDDTVHSVTDTEEYPLSGTI
ncbi:MAG: hypothetical protein HKN03_03600 [Acidimicrobiales bacterium]|nr:hypothetical protein [Acidimicrobiales bacterium]